MARYLLTRRVFNTLVGRGYKLICKICEFPFKIAKCPKCNSPNVVWVDKEKEKIRCNDCKFTDYACNIDGCVESKPSKYRRRKFYHCKCYDDSFIEVG